MERLGAQRALNSLLTGVSRRVAKTLVREPADLVHDLWVNHLVSARIAEHCARDVLPSLAVQAHALTLFMEVGEFVVLRAIATVAPELLAQAREPGSVVQQLIIGLHAQAGRHALRRWGLPQIFVQLAATHGEALPLDEELTPNQKLWLIVRLARDLTPRLTHVAIPSAHHVVTDDERRAMPELTAARLNRYAHLAVEDVKVVLGKSQNTGGLGV